ncbi:beta-lactamase-like protein [Aspergillus eucalypticola CBS 122712]|uniref:Beta-lactamase-like protein n=1 Tax=Aspergillus eucalypticola (strain CBS 122712 / IBT 29274) TaxID=1448314 RepID=A0A317UW55_ASPEC|nr:beta-lactamase-like protein [Aspergillus eucalypticola CBS 122712]PWY65895.1 beta-lactamase-like protein [Aspergillus eucalypticola CBS 122712]
MTTAQLQPSFSDRTDFDNASRGLIGSLEPGIIRAADGRPVYNNDAYHFLQESECPATANPKLWRQGQLASMQGLFEVTPGIYQIRGLDLANMTVVEGTEGVIVIDPLTSVECAAAALALYRKHRGDRPVTGVIYSHSHIDHFGGAQGVLPAADALSASPIPIVAPEGFVEEALSENMYVGPAMRRRAQYMYGAQLPKAADGQIGCGIGMTVSLGTNSFVPPNTIVTSTGEERIIDGVRIQFQLVPETEAPAEMNFFLPDHGALYIAECATHSLHNIITLRGALVRDAKAWARYLDESLVLFGQQSKVLFAGHNWPTWGTTQIEQLLSEQRDLYAYLHDQTVRMMNQGLTGIEIAETLTLPPALQTAWHAQGFYGSVSHNVKGIYQRYMGWFDGNPAHLWEYPPAENAKRYIACMGGIDEVLRKAEGFAQDGDLRFAATLLGHAVTFDAKHEQARRTLASVFEQLGFGAENATWRNFYLSAARDLRGEHQQPNANKLLSRTQSRQLNPRQSVEQWLTLLSVRLNGPAAASEAFTLDVHVTDEKQWWRLMVSNGVLTSRKSSDRGAIQGETSFTMSLTKQRLCEILSGNADLGDIEQEGDEAWLHRFLSLTA